MDLVKIALEDADRFTTASASSTAAAIRRRRSVGATNWIWPSPHSGFRK